MKTLGAILFGLTILVLLCFTFAIGINKMEEVAYIDCCNQSGGVILVSGFDCPIPSSCAKCSVELKECYYNLTNTVK